VSAQLLPACVVVAATLALGSTAQADDEGQVLAQRAGKGLVGMPAPPLTLTTIDGHTIDLGKLYGRQAIYLKFWATWCVPCRQQMPHFERTWQQAGPDLAVIAINAGFNDTVADVREYRRTVGITMPMVIDDGRVAAAFNLRVTPQHVVIGKDGRVSYIGHLADERLDQALKVARTATRGDVTAELRAATAPAPVKHVGVGDVLPATPAKTLDGREIRLRDPVDHRPTVLVFLSPWCESYLATSRPALAENCRRARERVETAAKSARVRWIGIASGRWATPDDLRGYQKKHAVRIPLVLDESGDTFRVFDVAQVPTVLLADEQGRVVKKLSGPDVAKDDAWTRTLAGD
jgi:peroxiredoxin